MSRQIIKQPNGLYCIFSSIVDNFIYLDCTVEDIKTILIEESKKDIEQSVDKTINSLSAGEKPYRNFTKTWEQILDRIQEVHGKKEINSIKKVLEK